ncbi:low specificity L-threonine aldolase [Lachnospiraceae bacterium OttesenSCG-928-J05]|nr:low specificity L-threonine aldolase [Lachnospiraceae bacterium OttesenSCG-928-J05]
MILFTSDYTEGAHPAIVEKLASTNMEQTVGYGEDAYCEEARGYIRRECGREDVDVHFLVGGTQTNMTVISAALRPHQGVLSAESGHINVHESGAIESYGHKVLSIPSADGKITASQVKEACISHREDDSFEHMVQPKMVYISHPTELGTLYTKAELVALREVCDAYDLYLFVDGARLGYGLMAPGSDVRLADLARLCDVFYIGGTKVGALFGEAVVITREELKKDFRYIIKQKGGMLAKGRLLGIQFAELFREDLYYQISDHGISMAMKLKEGFLEKSYKLFIESDTNQQFIIIPDEKLETLKEKFVFTYWQRLDDKTSVIRICTSWTTKEAAVDALLAEI